MHAEAPKILLVGRAFTPGSQFLERLCRNGGACAIAKSLEEARAALREKEFDLVLSDIALPDGSAVPLLSLLEGTLATLYFCVGVRDGCWWLPALARGQRTWGDAALRPPEFAHALETLLGEGMSHTAEGVPLAGAENANVIPIPSIQIASNKPERIQPEKTKAR